MSPDKKSTEPEAAARKGATFTFSVPFEGKPDKPIEMVIYAFSREGELLDSAPLREGRAKLSLTEAEAKSAQLMIAPPRPQSPGEKTITPEMLDRMRAYQPMWSFNPRVHEYELLPIPEFYWKCWFWCSCRARGRVVRPVLIGGVLHDMPVCNARVHICEVDRLWWLIPRLPEPIIARIRDELFKLIEWPPRPIPIPDPPPFEFDPGVIDPSPINIARMNSVAQARVSSPLEQVGLNPQPLPPRSMEMTSRHLMSAEGTANAAPAAAAQTVELSGAARLALQSTSVPGVRQTLLDHLEL